MLRRCVRVLAAKKTRKIGHAESSETFDVSTAPTVSRKLLGEEGSGQSSFEKSVKIDAVKKELLARFHHRTGPHDDHVLINNLRKLVKLTKSNSLSHRKLPTIFQQLELDAGDVAKVQDYGVKFEDVINEAPIVKTAKLSRPTQAWLDIIRTFPEAFAFHDPDDSFRSYVAMLHDSFNSAGKDVPTETLAKAATAHWKLLSPVERSAFHPSFRKLNPQAPEVTPVLKKRL